MAGILQDHSKSRNIVPYISERASLALGFTGLELSNSIRLARVNDGFESFSHASCNEALFLSEDRAEIDLPPSMVTDVEKLNAQLHDITPIWAFEPDKSSAYLYPHAVLKRG